MPDTFQRRQSRPFRPATNAGQMSSPGHGAAEVDVVEVDVVGQPRRSGSDAASGRVRLCCYLSSEEFGGMEPILASLLEFLPPRFDVTLLGDST